QMPAARKNPDIAFEVRKKLNVDAMAIAGNVVTEGAHGVTGCQLCAQIAQRVAGSRRHYAVIRVERTGFRTKIPAVGRTLNSEHARLFDLCPRSLRTIKQHSVQVVARINEQRVIELQIDGLALGRGENRFRDDLLWSVVFSQKRIFRIS